MDIVNIDLELKEALTDDVTGVKLVRITGDSEISIYAAEIAPNTALKPHYHKNGIEIYQVLNGCGTMKVGNYENNLAIWEDSFEVTSGDCFSISASKVHQIINNSDKVLRTIFTCPVDHLGQDRFFI
jgi:mannose-6-phosphate isomerase-like protein (cupin superfamily)